MIKTKPFNFSKEKKRIASVKCHSTDDDKINNLSKEIHFDLILAKKPMLNIDQTAIITEKSKICGKSKTSEYRNK